MTPTSFAIYNRTVRASTGVTEGQFVDYSGAACAAGTRPLGVATFDAATDELVTVTVLGTAVVTAGEAVAVGQSVEVGAAADAVVADTGVVAGIALTAASEAGESIEIRLV